MQNVQDIDHPVAKKPKLSLSAAPPSTSLSQQNDALWGEDFSECELDKCFQLATQACSQLQIQTSREDQATASSNISKSINTTKQNQNNGTTVQVSQKLVPSDIFNVPGGSGIAKDIIPPGKFRPKQWSNINNKSLLSVAAIRPPSASQSQQFAANSGKHNQHSSKFLPAKLSLEPNHGQLNHNELVKKLQNDNAKLKEEFLAKDGEISNLRIQLKQSDIKATGQLHTKMQEYEAKFRLMEKELEKAKTTAELQKLEAWKAKDKLLMVNQTATQNVPSESTIEDESVCSDQCGGVHRLHPEISVSYGELLFDTVTPHLFIKSSPEIHLIELKTSFSLLDDTTDMKGLTFNSICYTVETCWEPTMQLIRQESFDTVAAQCHIKKIFSECYKILCCLLVTLHERREEKTGCRLDSPDLQNARVKVDALDGPNLLSHEMWYTIERGVESRRALGLIAEISILSQHMTNLVTGTFQTEKQPTMMQQCDTVKSPHQVLAANGCPSTAQTLSNSQVEKSSPSRSAEEVNTEKQIHVLHENQSPKKLPSTKTPEVKEELNSKILVTGTSEKQPTMLQQCHTVQSPQQVLATNGGPSTAQTLSNIDQVEKSPLSRPAEEVNTEKQAHVLHENQSPKKLPCTKSPKVKEELESKIEEVESVYQSQDFGFLKLIRDISEIVSSQSNSFEYSGFLAGVAKLLANIQFNCSSVKDTHGFRDIVFVIVKTIIHSRPCMETIATVAELMDIFVSDTEFMNSLCNSYEEKPNLDDSCDNMVQSNQDENTCTLTILSRLLQRETYSVHTRTRVCRSLVNWMTFGVKCRPFRGPKWTQYPEPSQTEKCLCRKRMIEAMVVLIYKTFKDFEVFAKTSMKESIRTVLVRGILLLYYQLESDTDFGQHMADVEGYYQLLIMGLKNTEHYMGLDEHEGSILAQLLSMEETITPEMFELTTSLEERMDSIISTMELGWSDIE